MQKYLLLPPLSATLVESVIKRSCKLNLWDHKISMTLSCIQIYLANRTALLGLIVQSCQCQKSDITLSLEYHQNIMILYFSKLTLQPKKLLKQNYSRGIMGYGSKTKTAVCIIIYRILKYKIARDYAIPERVAHNWRLATVFTIFCSGSDFKYSNNCTS